MTGSGWITGIMGNTGGFQTEVGEILSSSVKADLMRAEQSSVGGVTAGIYSGCLDWITQNYLNYRVNVILNPTKDHHRLTGSVDLTGL